MTEHVTAPLETPPAVPEPLFKFDGKFAVYLAPDDAVVISYAARTPDGYADPGQHILPPMLLATAALATGQKPGDMVAKLKEMFG